MKPPLDEKAWARAVTPRWKLRLLRAVFPHRQMVTIGGRSYLLRETPADEVRGQWVVPLASLICLSAVVAFQPALWVSFLLAALVVAVALAVHA